MSENTINAQKFQKKAQVRNTTLRRIETTTILLVQANEPMRKRNIRSSPRFKSGKHFIYNGIISYYSTRHSLMGATDEVHLRTETRVLLKKERKKSLASERFSKQIARSVQGMLDAVTP